jgi:hypothetical protein
VQPFFYTVEIVYLSFEITLLLLIGRAGNGRVALQIILKKLNDIEEAIKFCRETGDQTLWAKLIEESEGNPGKNKKTTNNFRKNFL